jgi:uncharacterized protein YjbI with pentapeptide repeats
MKIWTKGIMTGLLAGGVILASLPAGAEPNRPDFGQREMRQERPIYQGVQSGQFTPGEFRRLDNQPGRINPAVARMQADGRLNRPEPARRNQMLNRSNRSIYQYRHNNFRQANFRPNNFGQNNFRQNNFRQPHFGQNNYRHNNFGQARFGQNNFRHNYLRQANWRPGRR